MSNSSSADKDITIKQGIFYILIQAGVIILAAMIFRADILLFGFAVGEDSLTEVTQQTLLFLMACCFVYISIINPQQRHFHILLAGFFTCMLIRELDQFFDRTVQHSFWVYPALLVAFASIVYALKEKNAAVTALRAFINHKCFYGLCNALVIILFFSRLFGMEDMWQEIMAENYNRQLKKIIEEGVELLGYSLLFYSSLVYTGDMHTRKSGAYK